MITRVEKLAVSEIRERLIKIIANVLQLNAAERSGVAF